MNDKRPVNLDLATIKFPVMAISSILHRIAGVVLFLLFPVITYFFELSLKNAGTFTQLQWWFSGSLCCKFVLWVFGAAIIYHLLAGIRHMVMDVGFGESLSAGRRSAVGVIAAAIFLTLLLGIWLW
ncbi:MAG: succinate dehydrogenase, cytochrome b556 subunit [Legionellales bacterium RIFCSPHIGHO2_12_FULL_42_9]|nr:MAG: succinate dehydrogenase, cytochrome b556 subunit [Legionellales bacterium RIFCSPHIGHO2_12_FULL_42_9]